MKKWLDKLTYRQRKNALIVGLFMVGLSGIALGILQYTDSYYTQRAEQASMAYDDLMTQFQKKEGDVVAKAQALITAYPKTPYAQTAQLVLAAEAFRHKDLQQVKDYLKEMLKENPGPFIHMARIRLARVLSSEQQFEEALSTLDVADKGGFDMLYQEVMGDIYGQQHAWDKAKQAYRLAIEAAPPGMSVAWLKLKQTDVGGSHDE